MRPLRLDLAGFTVFRDETTIDFTDADFFALVGPTGSGKSTVLDAICFALYGTVPRWRDPRSVVNALAPSAAEARVRLTFESAGARYVATRVVRRDGRGRVKTAGAGLQRMPDGFDVRRFDTGLTPEDLGEVLAGTPTEMDVAVPQVVGLPYEQFITCVVLPQGEFAEFLHAKPATRQQILVNLLGLSIYERIRERAAARAGQAEAELAATDRLLTDLGDVDEAALDAAEARLATMQDLVTKVEAALPRLASAQARRDTATAALAALDDQVSRLAAVRAPDEVAATAAAEAAARAALVRAAAAVGAAEERDEKLRGELAAAGDPGALRLLLAGYEERAQLAAQGDALTAALKVAQREHALASDALADAREQAQRGVEALEQAREAYAAAQTADRAAALRAHLVAGAPCPVCAQPVQTVPEAPADSAVAAAEAAGKAARAAADAAQKLVAERDGALRELDRTLAAAHAQAEQVIARLGELDRRLAGAPEPDQVRRELDAIAGTEQELGDAAAAVRAARDTQRRAQAEAQATEQRLRAAWRDFDATRDGLAALGAGSARGGPPPADRDDLAGAWAALAGWADARADACRADRDGAVAQVESATAAVAEVGAELVRRFTDADLPVPGGGAAGGGPPGDAGSCDGIVTSGDGTAFARAAAVAAERARAHRDQLAARRDQAARLRGRRGEHERTAQVARALAQHLRANNFEAWLLEEALDLLVEGASTILRELSAGQYDLVHDGREFFVIDHHDAGLRRAVRTLSGGETFQASLALALALSEQLAGLSTTAASLESIVLDEGFGTLDATTLDVVASTLENLAARGDRMVGVVTHVAALAERMPVRFEISKDSRSARVSRVGL